MSPEMFKGLLIAGYGVAVVMGMLSLFTVATYMLRYLNAFVKKEVEAEKRPVEVPKPPEEDVAAINAVVTALGKVTKLDEGRTFKVKVGEVELTLKLAKVTDSTAHVEVSGNMYEVKLTQQTIDVKPLKITVTDRKQVIKEVKVEEAKKPEAAKPTPKKPAQEVELGPNDVPVKTQVGGKVLRVLVREGDKVREGQPLLTIEAMKMELEIVAPEPGTVKRILVTEGSEVPPNSIVAIISKT